MPIAGDAELCLPKGVPSVGGTAVQPSPVFLTERFPLREKELGAPRLPVSQGSASSSPSSDMGYLLPLKEPRHGQ